MRSQRENEASAIKQDDTHGTSTKEARDLMSLLNALPFLSEASQEDFVSLNHGTILRLNPI